MRRAALSIVSVVALAGMALGPSASPIGAMDHGVMGQTFPIIEPDLLATIEAKLRHAEATGGIDRANAMFAKRAEAKIRRPTPVAGITPAEVERSWEFDPSITMERDITDQKGNLIAGAGQRVNPLDFVAIRQDLVFVDGDDAAQMAWALGRYDDLKAKIIFVSGSPIEAMTARQRRFYFDQEGKLTARFGIEHTPAVVTQSGRVMRVTEHALKQGRGG